MLVHWLHTGSYQILGANSNNQDAEKTTSNEVGISFKVVATAEKYGFLALRDRAKKEIETLAMGMDIFAIVNAVKTDLGTVDGAGKD